MDHKEKIDIGPIARAHSEGYVAELDSEYIDGFSKMQTEESGPVSINKTEHCDKVFLHNHEFYEMVLVDTGFSMHICDETTTILTGGDLFLVKPGKTHSYMSLHSVKIYNILFYDSFLGEDLQEFKKIYGMEEILGESGCGFMKLHVSLKEKQEIIALLEKVIWEIKNKKSGWHIKVKSLMMDFLISYMRKTTDYHKSGQEITSNFTQINSALRYIETNYNKDISVKDIAQATGLSPDYMSKQFKNMVGVGPAEYYRNLRMAKAMEMLKNSDISITEVAEQLGFCDTSIFSRQFKQIVGVSPTAFRAGKNQKLKRSSYE